MSFVILSPIHVEAVGLSKVRFFAPPTGAREFPWPSIDDLFAAVVMDRRMRRLFRTDIQTSPWAGDTRKIVTPNGRTIIGQHFIVQGLIEAWVQVGRCQPDLYSRYTVGGAKTLSKLTEGMHGHELMAYCRDALPPIATPEIAGTPARFFKSPEIGPHLPWHAVDDLYRAMKFPRDLRRIMLRNAQDFAGGDFKTVATAEGPVVIGSHPMAQGLIGAAIEAHGTDPGFEMTYAKATAAAMEAQFGDLGPEARFRLLLDAARNTLGLAGDVS